jgi:aminoglycoside phosphotransferase (APT) family kinase protein
MLAPAALDALARRAVGAGVAEARELANGYANAVWHLTLDDGRRLVLKLSPPPELEQLSYERDLLRTEALVYRLCEPTGVPMPTLIHTGFDDPVLGGDYLVLSALDGVPWNQAAASLDPADERALRRELGRHLAEFNTVTGEVFGYPHAGLTGATWRAAFLTMVGAVLRDSARYATPLPLSASEIAAAIAAVSGVLDDVRVPSLVHFDIWPGNVFLTLDDGPPRIQAIIDHERAFWGDPLADFVTPTIFGELTESDELVAGYREAGGRIELNSSAQARLALYRAYLSLIMLVEEGPRQYPEEEYGRIREKASATLVRALDRLR